MPRKRIRITEQPEIKKLKRGGHSIRFRIPEHDGQEATKSAWRKCPVSKKGELGSYIEEYRAELEDNINAWGTREDITLGEYARLWHEDREGSPEINHLSWRREGDQIREIENSCIAGISIQELTPEDIEEFKKSNAKKKWSADKQRRVLGKLKQITRHAKKKKKTAHDAAEDVDNIPVVKKKRKALPEEKVREIIKALETEEQTGKRAVIKLAICGLRRGECLGLKWGHVDLKNRELTIEQQYNAEREEVEPKHHSGGIVPIDADTADWLRRWKKKTSALWYEGGAVPDDAPVCANDHGGMIDSGNFDPWRRRWFVEHGLGTFENVEEWRDKNGIKRYRQTGYDGYTLHELRHTAATDLVASGADLRSVQGIMRHKKLSTTEGYLHEREAKMRSAVDALGEERRAQIIDEEEKPKRMIYTAAKAVDPKAPKRKRQKPLKDVLEEK